MIECDLEAPTVLVEDAVQLESQPSSHQSRIEPAERFENKAPKKSSYKFIEHHESEPHFMRPALFTKVKEVIKEIPHLKDVHLSAEEFHFEQSWFALLWVCQRICKINGPDEESDINQH